MKNTYDILVAPIISEKSMDGTSNKRYTFEVKRDATKPEIAAAVAEAFGVKVAAVNTSIVKGKPKRHGYSNGYHFRMEESCCNSDPVIRRPLSSSKE